MSKRSLEQYIEAEIGAAKEMSRAGRQEDAFRHLERAHVLGQSNTNHHTRVHWLMMKHGLKYRDLREVAGQTLRMVGAATKTPLGIYPEGNTGGANVSPIRPMPIPEDLKEVLNKVGKR